MKSYTFLVSQTAYRTAKIVIEADGRDDAWEKLGEMTAADVPKAEWDDWQPVNEIEDIEGPTED